MFCSNNQWNNHISALHPEIKDNPDLVINTIKDPVVIYQSQDHYDRDAYFKEYSLNTGEYIKVVVEIKNNFGDVITAFPVNDIKGNINKEELRYAKPQL